MARKETVIGIEFEGTKIVLPVIDGKQLDYDSAVRWILRQKELDNKTVLITHTIECSPLDGIVAFHKALAKKFGWINLKESQSFFGVNPPKMIGVPISADEVIQAPLGDVEIPGIDGYLSIGVKMNPPSISIVAEVKRKSEKDVLEIVDETKKVLALESIYKGKAVKISFQWERDGENYHPITNAPRFMALDEKLASSLVFNESVQDALDIGLFAPIENSNECRLCGVPLKRGILLYGAYGTGKTLTATVTATKAVKNGWTFLYLDSVLDLHRGLEFAAHYAPAVLFAEDIDRVMQGERSESMDSILNTLDGIETKSSEIIAVFTTNHIEKINPAILRMGRLDSLIEMKTPDAKAAQALVRLYGRGFLSDVDLTDAGKALAGKIPAFIRETVERAKIAAIARLHSAEIVGKVSVADLLSAARAMEMHNALLQPKEEKTPLGKANLFVQVPQGFSGASDIALHQACKDLIGLSGALHVNGKLSETKSETK